jgi:hypothetical protein
VGVGEPTQPPIITPAQGPPSWDENFDQTPTYDLTLAQPAPDYEFDQNVSG